MPTWLSWYRNVLLRIVVPLQLRYPPRDGRLLSRRKLILATLAAGLCCGALFILGIDRDFRRVEAGVDNVRPSWRYRGGRVWEHLDVWHVAVVKVEVAGKVRK